MAPIDRPARPPPLRRRPLMPFLVPQFSSRNSEHSASWLRRVLENIRAAFSIPHARLPSANGAPAFFSSVNTSTRYGSAQSISALAHAAILGVLFFLLASSTGRVTGLHLTPLEAPARRSTSLPLQNQNQDTPLSAFAAAAAKMIPHRRA